MPVGTVTKNTERFELVSLPGAYVLIRRMSFGEKLERQDEMINMRTQDKELSIQMMNKKLTLRDFGNLILDHNITDENERKLNFKDQNDAISLDPRVGEEIATRIDSINAFEELDTTKN